MKELQEIKILTSFRNPDGGYFVLLETKNDFKFALVTKEDIKKMFEKKKGETKFNIKQDLKVYTKEEAILKFIELVNISILTEFELKEKK